MNCISRILEFVAALILEVTVFYVNDNFADILAADARFMAFLLCTAYLIWLLPA